MARYVYRCAQGTFTVVWQYGHEPKQPRRKEQWAAMLVMKVLSSPEFAEPGFVGMVVSWGGVKAQVTLHSRDPQYVFHG